MQVPEAARPLLFVALLLAAASAPSWLQPSGPSGTPPATAAPPPQERAPNPAAPGWNGSDCRWEVIPLEGRFFPDSPNQALPPGSARTLLLDQCAGTTWVLRPHGGPPEAAWMPLEREPAQAFRR